MVAVEVANEWYLVVCEGLGGREGEQARRLPVWELGRCRVLGERLRAPRMSELVAGGWCRWGRPMSGSCWWWRVCEGGRGAGADGGAWGGAWGVSGAGREAESAANE